MDATRQAARQVEPITYPAATHNHINVYGWLVVGEYVEITHICRF